MTKKLSLWLTKALCLVSFMLVMGAMPRPAAATNLEDLQARQADGRAYWVYASSSASQAMELWYTGSATESVVTITSTTMLFYAPAGTLDTAVGAGGGIDLSAAAYDTFGELCDYLDGLSNYGCVLLGGKRSDNTNRLRDQTATSGTNDLKAAGGFKVQFDTNPVNGGTNDGNFDLRVWATPSSPTRRVVLRACEWNANGVTNTDTLKVFGRSLERDLEVRVPNRPQATLDTSTQVWQGFITDDTDQVRDFTATGGVGWMFGAGARIVVSAGNGTSVQAGSNYLRCLFEER